MVRKVNTTLKPQRTNEFQDLDAAKEAIQESFQQFVTKLQAIISDYSCDSPAMLDEINRAVDNHKELVEDVELVELKADDLVEVLKDADDFDRVDVADIFSTSDCAKHVSRQGYFVIDLQGSMDARTKLEDFIKAEIYTAYNDQRMFID